MHHLPPVIAEGLGNSNNKNERERLPEGRLIGQETLYIIILKYYILRYSLISQFINRNFYLL
jgi:hypothetical protein